MEKFQKISSIAVPLGLSDVDTDMIIPAQYLTSTSREGFGLALFKRFCEQDATFVLNDERYRGAKILVARENFGCGSSREHAVWALLGAGFKVVIAESYADIFYANSAKNGLLLVRLQGEIIERIILAIKDENVIVDVSLETQTVKVEGKVESLGEFLFEYDSFRKHCLLNGLDDLDYLLSRREEIVNHRSKEATWKNQ